MNEAPEDNRGLGESRMSDHPAGRDGGGDYPRLRTGLEKDAGWQRTLWAMVGIQFIMTAAINFLSPIIPLMLPRLGVQTVEGVDVWAGVITGSTQCIAAVYRP